MLREPQGPGPVTAPPEPSAQGRCYQLFLPPPSERWLETLAALPRWTAGRLPLQGWSVPPQPPPAPHLPGTRVRVDRIRLEYRQNPLFIFRLIWRADQAFEERLVVMADSDGQWVEPTSIPTQGLPSPAPGARGQVYGLQRLLQQAMEVLPRWAEVRGHPFRSGVEHRRRTEDGRLNAYYRGLEEEASEPLRSALAQIEGFWARMLLPGSPLRELPSETKDHLDSLREELAETRARLGRERLRRMAEVAERYRVRLEVELLGGALLWIPHAVLQLTLRADRVQGEEEPLELEVAWNLAQARWSGLDCQECGRESDRLLLCRCPRLLCPGCAGPCSCGSVLCRECASGACAACERWTCGDCHGLLAPGRIQPSAAACPECRASSEESLASLDALGAASRFRTMEAFSGGR